jgi:hypothetical protein
VVDKGWRLKFERLVPNSFIGRRGRKKVEARPASFHEAFERGCLTVREMTIAEVKRLER